MHLRRPNTCQSKIGDGWHIWSSYLGRDDLSGGRVHTGRLEETTAEKRHLQMLVCACRKTIEMEWDAMRVVTVLQTDGWPFLSRKVTVRNQTALMVMLPNTF